ncbi:MAG TPA: flagellar hook-basal body complex protein FliE [Dissulfurispiraceae bacterium]|nr:flagellar hook-basal body complex protein FliE [Dissulfurispiraceae bacterium]
MSDIGNITTDIKPVISEPVKAAQKGSVSFDNAIKDALKEVSVVQNNADKAIEDFSKGKVQDIHTVVLAMEKADMSMQTLLQVRNKLLNAYNTIMSMQV